MLCYEGRGSETCPYILLQVYHHKPQSVKVSRGMECWREE
jgi:hypothetical protein